MKLIFEEYYGIWQTNLYPTRFRWNLLKCPYKCKQFRIYIPHGSDETFLYSSNWSITALFISHTVQMKHDISQWETHNKANLYPTRFRWNPHRGKNIKSFSELFISHTVQMKQRSLFLCRWKHRHDLYPTRFRWNWLWTFLIHDR